MEKAKPGSWIKKPEPKKKRPFVLKPHLTERPLHDSPELQALRKKLGKEA